MSVDYSTRLVSLSWHFLSPEECQARARADINPDFRFCDLRVEANDGYYFEPDKDHFNELLGPDRTLLDCLQIDLLRPTYDYLDLKYNSLLHLLFGIERVLVDSLSSRGIEAQWSMIYATTENDSPVSAYRRTLVFPNCGFDGSPIRNSPRSADLPLDLIAELENDLETYFRSNMDREHYA